MRVIGEVTKIIDALNQGETGAEQALFSVVYAELRRLAMHRMIREAPGQTLQATALVHEAYIKLVGADQRKPWEHRGHFFAAAAKAMDRILVDQVRHKRALKRGGDRNKVEVDVAEFWALGPDDLVLAIHDALADLEEVKADAASLVRLRFFARMTNQEAAEALGVGARTANRLWDYARAWLHDRLGDDFPASSDLPDINL